MEQDFGSGSIRFKKEVLLRELSLFDSGSVKYTNSSVNLMEGLYENSNPARNIIFTKDLIWEYEREFRLVHQDVAKSDGDNHRICKYSDEAIDCIILGFNSSPECLDEIKRIISEKGVLLKKIERSTYGFELYVGTGRY